MTHSPADIIRTLLITIGQGSDPDAPTTWPIFADKEPTAPDEVVTVFNTDGPNQGRTMFDGEVQGPNGIQVRIRSKTPAAGWTKADAIYTALAQSIYRNRVTIGTSNYLVQCVAKIGNVIPLGKESPTSQRNVFTINAVTTITQCH